MIKTSTQVIVRYVETDAMGITHHSNYPIWFEVARIDLLDQLGLPYNKIEQEGFFIPVVELYIKYLKPSYFNDTIIIHTSIQEKPRIKFKIHYEIFCNDVLIAKGYSTHTFINKEGRPIRPHEQFIQIMNQHFVSNTIE